MEQDLCKYMTLQASEIEKILENMEQEHSAILANDRQQMKYILEERGSILEEIQRLGDKVNKEISRLDIDRIEENNNPSLLHLHQEIGQLLAEINRCNNRNKLLLEFRLRSS